MQVRQLSQNLSLTLARGMKWGGQAPLLNGAPR